MNIPLKQKLSELGMAVSRLTWAIERPNPYLIFGPAVISFSGGRTSAYMLHQILQAHGGRLPDDVIVLFQNTGREMEGTLEFVRDVGVNFNVPIVWLEYDGTGEKPSYRRVAFETASRDGRPFEEMLTRKSALPNPVARFCTIELKIRTAKRFIVAEYGWKRWTNVVGLRRDEPARVVKATDPTRNKKDRWDVICPLWEAGVEQHDVFAFWKRQPFDLMLAGPWEGNCDGCFLKNKGAISRMCADYPERLQWWADQEATPRGDGNGKAFRRPGSRASYAVMIAEAQAGKLAKYDPADDLPCDDLGCGI